MHFFSTVVLFLVMDIEWNLYDQRAMEYATEEIFCSQNKSESDLSQKNCHVIRRTPEQMHKAQLNEDKALIMYVLMIKAILVHLLIKHMIDFIHTFNFIWGHFLLDIS